MRTSCPKLATLLATPLMVANPPALPPRSRYMTCDPQKKEEKQATAASASGQHRFPSWEKREGSMCGSSVRKMNEKVGAMQLRYTRGIGLARSR